jgi:hypothetical protein
MEVTICDIQKTQANAYDRTRKTCALALYNQRRRQRAGLCAIAERQFNITPYYSDRAGSTEQSQNVAVVL